MEIRGFLLNRRGKRLYYCFHSVEKARSAWLFCNPFLEEKTFTHPLYVNLARQFAHAGQAVLRFDYEGDGDSEGDTSTVSLHDWQNDIVDMAALLQRDHHISELRLFGVRLGASLACLTAATLRAQSVLAWEPIVRGESYLQECLMLNLTTQLATYKKVNDDRKSLLQRLHNGETVNISGYDISHRLSDELQQMDLTSTIAQLPCPVHIVAVQKIAGAALNRDLHALTQWAHVQIEACHTLPFWYEPKQFDGQQLAMQNASRSALPFLEIR